MCGGGDTVKRVSFPEKFKCLSIASWVELTGLGSLCLSKRVGVPRLCVGAVMR